MPNQFTSQFGGAGTGARNTVGSQINGVGALPNQDPYKMPNLAQRSGMRTPAARTGTSNSMSALGQPAPGQSTMTGAPPPVPGQQSPASAGIPTGLASGAPPVAPPNGPAPALGQQRAAAAVPYTAAAAQAPMTPAAGGMRSAHAVNPYGGINLPNYSPGEAAAGLGPGSSPASVAAYETQLAEQKPEAVSQSLGTNLLAELNGQQSPASIGLTGQAEQIANAAKQRATQEAYASGQGMAGASAAGSQINGQLAAALDAQRAKLYQDAKTQSGEYLQTGAAPALQLANLQNTQAQTGIQQENADTQKLNAIISGVTGVGGALGLTNTNNLPGILNLASILKSATPATGGAATPAVGTGAISIGQPDGAAGLFGSVGSLSPNARPAPGAGGNFSKPWWM